MLVGIVQVDARTTTGTTDLTVSGYGTCKGAIFWITRATTDNTAADEAVLGYGATDGTRDRCCATSSQHNLSDTNTFKRAKTGKCVLMIDPNDGSIDGEAGFDSFITDGVRINTTNAFAAGYKINALLFFGSDCSLYVGDFDTASGSVDVTAPGFQPTIVNVFGNRAAIDDTARANAGFSHGWAYYDGSTVTQNSMNWGEDDAVATGQPYMRPENALVQRDLQNATLGGTVSLDTFDSSGFTATQGNSAGYPCMYVAIKCDNRCHNAQYGTRIATGNFSHTNAGFRPMAVFGHMTRIRTTNATNEANLAGTLGLYGFTSTTAEFSAGIQTQDAAATTNTQSLCDSVALNLATDAGAAAYVANVNSILSNGFELNYTTVDSNNRIFSGLAVQELVFTAMTVTADATAVVFDADKISQTSPTMSAGAATVAMTTQFGHTTSSAVRASVATVTPDVDKVIQAPQLAADIPAGQSSAFSRPSGNDLSGSDVWEVWLKADTLQSCAIFSRWSLLGTKLYQLALGGTGTLTWQVFGGAATVSTTIVAGLWYQIIVGFDEGNELFIRASAVGGPFGTKASTTSGVPSTPVGNQAFALGVSQLLVNGSFDGKIQRFRHFDSIIGDANEEVLWNSGRGYTTAELAAAQPALHGNASESYDLMEYSTGASAVPRKDSINVGAFMSDGGLIPSAGGHGTLLIPSPATTTFDMDVIRQTATTVSAGAATTVVAAQRVVRHRQEFCADFDGASHFISSLLAEWQWQSGFEFWFKPSDINHDGGLYCIWDASGDPTLSTIRVFLRGKTLWLEYVDGQDFSVYSHDTGFQPTDGRWHQVVVEIVGAAAEIALIVSQDGVPDVFRFTTSLPVGFLPNQPDPTPFHFGLEPESNEFFLGQAMKVRNFVGAFTTFDIANLYLLYNWGAGLETDRGGTLILPSPFGAVTLAAMELDEYSSGVTQVDRAVQHTFGGPNSFATDNNGVPSAVRGWWVGNPHATAVFDADKISQTSMTVSAGAATTVIAAQLVHQTTTAASASGATTVFSAQKRMHVTMAVTADAATTTFDMDVIRQTVTFAVSADPATVAIDADLVLHATVTVSAGAATTIFDAQLVHQTTTAAQADVATTVFSAQKRMHVTMTVSADAATVALDVDVIRQTVTFAVTADPATTSIDAQRIVQTTVAVAADAATVAIDAEVIAGGGLITTDVAVSAGAATVVFDADVIRQTAIAVSADTATASIDADRVVQTTTAVSADAATTSIAGQKYATASMAVTAGAATTIFDAQLVHQTTVTASADAATVAISAEIVGTISADMVVTAGAATTSIDAQLIHLTSTAVTASTATTAAPTQRIPQTTLTVSAGAATTALDGTVIQVTGTAAVSAGAATVALAAQRLSQAALALQAASAASAIDADRIAQASVSVSAGAATTALDADRVVQTTATLQAGAATASISGTTIQVQATVAVTADPATASISGQVIRQAAVAVSAGAPTSNATGQLVHQTSVAVQCGAATVVIAAGLNVTTDLALSMGLATATIVGQRIVQTAMAVQASPARGQALEVVIPSRLEAPAVVFEMRTSYDVAVPEARVTILHDEFERTIVSPDLVAFLFFKANNKLVASAIAVQASPATVNISGVVL